MSLNLAHLVVIA